MLRYTNKNVNKRPVAESAFCPLLRTECVREKCAWYYKTDTLHGACVVKYLIESIKPGR